MRILVGFIWDGKSGGIDAYLMAFACVAQSEGIHLDFLTNEYCENLAVELDGMGHRLYEIATLHDRASQKKTIKSLCENNSYDAAYFNVSTAIMYPVVKDASSAGVKKIIVHSHAADVDEVAGWKKRILRVLNRLLRSRLRKCATMCVACSFAAAEWAFGLKNGEALIVPNPVDIGACSFDPDMRTLKREELGLEGRYVVGSVTGMKEIKNPVLLVDVFSEFQAIVDNSVLVVVGSGHLYDSIVNYASEKLISETVLFLGKRDDVCELLQAFDVFVLTSRKEGLSIAAVEAQVAGLPCVLSDGVPEEAVVDPSLVARCCLDESEATWAKRLLSLHDEWIAGYGRRSYAREASDKGFSLDSPRKVILASNLVKLRYSDQGNNGEGSPSLDG